MHELPKDLGNSLRSFRNSVHRNSGQHDFDLEKLEAPADLLSGKSKKQPNETSSSLILVSSHRMFCLRDASNQIYSIRLFHVKV